MSTEVNRAGCFAEGDGWIEVFSGLPFNVADPDPDSINLVDIAHSLSMQCRYNGHCTRFVSVGEHCCHVHDCIWEETGDALLSFAGLLHDGSEYALTDIVRPVKPLLANYHSLEAKLQEVIYDRFDIPAAYRHHEIIKRYDNSVCMAEAQQVMKSAGAAWNWGLVQPASILVKSWPPDIAKREFLKRALSCLNLLGRRPDSLL